MSTETVMACHINTRALRRRHCARPASITAHASLLTTSTGKSHACAYHSHYGALTVVVLTTGKKN